MPIKRNSHEDKQWHGHERFVGHDAVNAAWQAGEKSGFEATTDDAKEGKQQRSATQRKRNRESSQQEQDHRRK